MSGVRIATPIVLLLCGASVALGQAATASLYGAWKVDVTASSEVPGDHSITWRFESDGTLHMIVADEFGAGSFAGTWNVVEELPHGLYLEMTIEGESMTPCFHYLDADTIRAVESTGTTTLRRVQNTSAGP